VGDGLRSLLAHESEDGLRVEHVDAPGRTRATNGQHVVPRSLQRAAQMRPDEAIGPGHHDSHSGMMQPRQGRSRVLRRPLEKRVDKTSATPASCYGARMGRPLKERLQGLFAEYGRVAIYTYFAIFLLVRAGFARALQFGVEVESAGAGATVLGGAYVATKLTQPLRIFATLLLTPPVAALQRRLLAPPSTPSKPTDPESEGPNDPIEQPASRSGD
jgi:hypothetical protein